MRAILFAALVLATAATAQTDYREQAFAAQKAGETEKAAELFMRLYKAGADDKEVLATGADCLEKTGRLRDALDVLARGKKKFPEDPTFAVGLARVYNRQAATTLRESGKMDTNVVFNFQDAIREAEAALAKWPDNRDARLILASTHHSLGEWDKAKAAAEEVVRRFPEHPGAYIILGDLAFEHFKLLRNRAAEKGADTSEAAMLKIAAARDAAKQSYEKAIALDDSRIVAHRKLGDVYAWNAEVKRAIDKYREVLRRDPLAPVNHDWIQKGLDEKERFPFYEKLGKEYLASPGADRKKAAIFAWYAAGALTAEKKYRQAEEMYLHAQHLNADYVSGYYYAMYSAYYYRKDADAALTYAGRYAAKAPIQFADLIKGLPTQYQDSLAELIEFLALKALEKKLGDECRDLNHVLAAIVDTADAWNNYAFLARETKRYEESEKAYRHALEIEPSSGQLMNDLGVILQYHKGTAKDLKEAKTLYTRAIAAAKQALKKRDLTPEQKARERQTISDASGNLKKLAKDMKAPRKSGG